MHVPILGPRVQRQLWFGRGHFVCELHAYPVRLASTSARHPYPFPTRASPSPHEIFHLARNASQEEIKARYIDLVKVYHPDTHFAKRVPPALRNSRFRAITQAYAALRGKGSFGGAFDQRSSDDVMRAELRRRRRRYTAENTAESSASSTPASDADLTFVPLVIVLVGVVSAMSLSSSHLEGVRRKTQAAAANLAEARAGAEEFGMERRRAIRELVRKMQEERDMEASETLQATEEAPRDPSDDEVNEGSI